MQQSLDDKMPAQQEIDVKKSEKLSYFLPNGYVDNLEKVPHIPIQQPLLSFITE